MTHLRTRRDTFLTQFRLRVATFVPLLRLSSTLLSASLVFLPACTHSPSPQLPGKVIEDPLRTAQLQEATRAHRQALSLFDDGLYTEAVSPAQAALSIREQLLGPEHVDIAEALTTLGLIYSTLIELPRAQDLLERALNMRRSLLGPEHAQVGESLTNLGGVLYAKGDFINAITLLERSLKIQEHALGANHPLVAVTLTHLAIAQRGLSRLDVALKNSERAIAILRTTEPARPKDLGMALNVAGNIQARRGNFETARTLLEESLHRFEQTSGASHPHAGSALIQLAMMEGKQGNPRAEIPLLRRALSIFERSYGKDNAEIAGITYEIGLAERALGHLESAQPWFERTLTIQRQSVGPRHPFVALTLIALAELKRQQKDQAAARDLLQQALDIQEQSLGPEHTSVAQTLTVLGYLQARSLNLSDAEHSFERALRIRENALGPVHPDVATSLLNLARAKHAEGELSAARPLYERARRIIEAQVGLNSGLDDEALSRIWKGEMKGLRDYAELLATLGRTSQAASEQHAAIADGFLITQQARGWLMQSAVARTMAQREAGSSANVRLARRVEDLRRKRQELWKELNDLYGLPENQRDSPQFTKAKRRLEEVQQAIVQASHELRSIAPRYAELRQPEPLQLEGAQQLLAEHETLVSFYTLEQRVQIWVVRPGRPVIYREASITREDLISAVSQLRSSLLSVSIPFDVDTSAKLYQELFASIASFLVGSDHLILVPDDILLPLPFAALVTGRDSDAFHHLSDLHRQKERPTGENFLQYAMLPWLAQSYPLTILPSVSALKLLRAQPLREERLGENFIGFGDPVFSGKGKERGGPIHANHGIQVDVDALRELNRLPGTREELLTVAKVLGANPETAVFLGTQATETEVRQLNESGRLGKARVLSFATHGLLAGEVKGLAQPALVLTPPATPTEVDDGLLSLEDVLQLKLPSTDWVVLSACNTAGDNGSGESLSGLARAFFFAGAKALLVSQWSVDDEATRSLMIEIFSRYGGHSSIAPTEALQEGMLAILERAKQDPGKRYFAHPFAWASFFLVGEGNVLREQNLSL